MVIYADILIVLNTLTDYFLIKLAGIISKNSFVFWRTATASVLGGLFSLYIFFDKSNFALNLLIKLIMCAVICLISFGFNNIKFFIKSLVSLFSVTLLFGGMMIGIYLIYKPENMVIKNSVVYINISPVILIVSSAVYYITALIIRHFTAKTAETAQSLMISVSINRLTYSLNTMVDTGNSLTDILGQSEIIIIDSKIGEKLKSELDENELNRRFRVLPVKTVSGKTVLQGIRADKAVILENKKKITIKNPVLAISKTPLEIEWDAIINPRSII